MFLREQRINSDLVFYSPAFPENDHPNRTFCNRWISVELTFADPILAVIGNAVDLHATSALFGLDECDL